jgi:hypothetical protein
VLKTKPAAEQCSVIGNVKYLAQRTGASTATLIQRKPLVFWKQALLERAAS